VVVWVQWFVTLPQDSYVGTEWRRFCTSNNHPTRKVSNNMTDSTVDEDAKFLPVKAIKEVETMDFEQYQAWLREEEIGVQEFEGGSEWELIEKEKLVDVPFIIARIRFNDGDFGDFTSVCCFLQDGKKVVFNDGSTGIKKQLQTAISKNGRETGIFCEGLKASHYKYTDNNPESKTYGKELPATTYYIK
jgi:hypothetical protein